MIFLLLISWITGKLAGENDGSATYFIFTGVTWIAFLGSAGAFLRFVWLICVWAWAHM